MRRILSCFLTLLTGMTLAGGASCVWANERTFTVGVEDYPNFLPYSEFKNDTYGGLGRAILDAFAKKHGYKFEY
ncbi:MAG: hypothetical protein JO002_17980, partial [Burkholderiaceae bacterium]|nr:hypothetical protein [Burkholderiaceae bacterium]